MAELELRTRMNFEYGVPRELVPGVERVVAKNPSPFTFKGTNTYIVGTRDVAIIDPGPEDEAHCDAVVTAVGGRRVSHILLTHTHHDHLDGLDRLHAAVGGIVCGYGREAPATPSRSAYDGSESSKKSFRPEIVMRDGDKIAGEGWAITALHTPGHAPDHLAFALEGTGVLFSGDHVMAWNTSVVAPPEGRMADYLPALEKLIGRGDTLYLPGHGGKLMSPERMVRAYLWHRHQRERSIYDAVADGRRTINEIVSLVYPGLDPRLVRAASLSVQAHVEHLIEQSRLTCDGPVTWDRQLSLA